MSHPIALFLVSVEDDPGIAVRAYYEALEDWRPGFTFVVIIHTYTKAADVAVLVDLPR